MKRCFTFSRNKEIHKENIYFCLLFKKNILFFAEPKKQLKLDVQESDYPTQLWVFGFILGIFKTRVYLSADSPFPCFLVDCPSFHPDLVLLQVP